MTAIEGAGTTEEQWGPFLVDLAAPELDLSAPPLRVVVVAPHPDDEILAVGGLLALLAAHGTEVEVVAVTDGEASHPGGSLSPAQLSPLRVAETHAALAALGVPASVRRLGLPDGGGDGLEAPVVQALALTSHDWLLGPWQGEGHPDHEAVGRACARATARDGARLLSYLVWTWHWASPADHRVPWSRARLVPLPEPVRAAKAAAVQAFMTQVRPLGPLPTDAPVLPPHVLARFARPTELVLT